ncbi:nuclear transport factor 2 (NTF2) family protein [Tasmannia lanceolata]|uniref:nuclear transport factor 2 (NTF2) family protein n=1 Tax=Tasmannia lanceolata TaxID=3420 RepID=UPI0040644C61
MESPAATQPESGNKHTVESFYEALIHGDAERVAGLLAPDLEWWFHGPPCCQHMMRVLTGESAHEDFQFVPRSLTAIDDKVFAEGWEGAHVYWVHVWTLKDGVITQFREYFNTWLTVQDVRPLLWEAKHECSTLWQSEPREHSNRSLPELLLAI